MNRGRKKRAVQFSANNECIIIDLTEDTPPKNPKNLTANRIPLNDVSNKMNCDQPCSSKPQKIPPTTALLENTEEFVCSLCLSFIQPRIGVTLRECRHNFCRQCLIQEIYINHDPQSGAVQCPLKIENCNNFLLDAELQKLLGDEYVVFQEQIKYNMEVVKSRKEQRRQSLLPMLLTMTDLEPIPNFEPFECSICLSEINSGEGMILQNCLHQFCKECLTGCIASAEEFDVKCPFIEEQFPCKESLREVEIRSLVSEDVFDKHLQKSLKLAENANELTFHCRTPDCPTFVEIDQEVLDFKCEACGRINCVPCKAIHEGKSCTEYQEEVNPDLKTARVNNENAQSEKAIEKMILSKKAMRCPRCTIPVEKIIGCDFITCAACKLGICWVTQKPRNDLKKADGTIIKGCGCRENGKWCHEKCKNCH